jgi:hypothetical protein
VEGVIARRLPVDETGFERVPGLLNVGVDRHGGLPALRRGVVLTGRRGGRIQGVGGTAAGEAALNGGKS